MKRQSLAAAALSGSPDDVEQAFYEALGQADLQQLMACWAEDDDIVCVQPDGQRCMGPAAIRAAFEALLAPGGLQIRPLHVHRIQALASAVHHLLEQVVAVTPQGQQTSWVTATNVYHKTPQGWRLVLHHASPGSAEPPQDAAGQPAVLH